MEKTYRRVVVDIEFVDLRGEGCCRVGGHFFFFPWWPRRTMLSVEGEEEGEGGGGGGESEHGNVLAEMELT